MAASEAALPVAVLRLRQRRSPQTVPLVPAAAERTGFPRSATVAVATVNSVTRTELDAATAHFTDHGWVVVDALSPRARRALPRWADEVAALPDGDRRAPAPGSAPSTGRSCAAARTSCPSHAELRTLLCTGTLLDVAGALLGEPAVLYKEKINYKLPGGAGYSAHQDAPAYPMIAAHVSAMVAIDDADESNGGLEVVSDRFDAVLPTRRARVHRAHRSSRRSTGCRWRCRAGQHAVVPQPHAAPQRGQPLDRGPAGRSTPPTTPPARATSGPRTTTAKRAAFAAADPRRPRAGVAHRRLRRSAGMKVVFTVLDALPVRHVGERAHPGAPRAGARGGRLRRHGSRAVMTSATYPNHATFATGAARHTSTASVTNWVPRTGGVVPAWKLGPARAHAVRRVPGRAGDRAAAVLGDQCLVGVMGAVTADTHWPPDGESAGERATRRARLHRRPRHDRGAGRRARRRCPIWWSASSTRRTPRRTCTVPTARRRWPCTARPTRCWSRSRDHLDWDDTVWIVVSDHDQEGLDDRPPHRPASGVRPARASICSRSPRATPPSSAAPVRTTRRAWLSEVDGVEGTAPFPVADPSLECCLAWSVAGARVRVRGDGHRARHPRRPPHPQSGGGGHRRPPRRGTAGRRARATVGSRPPTGPRPSPPSSISSSRARPVVRCSDPYPGERAANGCVMCSSFDTCW